jgi:hypothetical protein
MEGDNKASARNACKTGTRISSLALWGFIQAARRSWTICISSQALIRFGQRSVSKKNFNFKFNLNFAAIVGTLDIVHITLPQEFRPRYVSS